MSNQTHKNNTQLHEKEKIVSADFIELGKICVILLLSFFVGIKFTSYTKNPTAPTSGNSEIKISPSTSIKNPNNTNPTLVPTIPPRKREVKKLKDNPTEDIYYIDNANLMKLTTKGSIEKAFKTDNLPNVNLFSYSQKQNAIAYLAGNRTKNNDPNIVIPQSAHIYFVDTNLDVKIVDKPVSEQQYNSQDNDRNDILTDINFSEDGSMLAVTTRNMLYIYDVVKKTMSQIPLPVDNTEDNMGQIIYSVYSPKFNTDNSSLIITTGYWEGGGSMLVDIANKTVKKLPYFGYIAGTYVLGWRNNNHFVVFEKISEEYTGAKLYLVNTATLEKSEINHAITGFPNMIDSNNLLFTKTDDNIESIIKFNLDTKSSDNIYTHKVDLNENEQLELGNIRSIKNSTIYLQNTIKAGQSNSIFTVLNQYESKMQNYQDANDQQQYNQIKDQSENTYLQIDLDNKFPPKELLRIISK